MERESYTLGFMQGNEAILEGAVRAGARFYAGYPITPSSEIAQLAAQRLPAVGGIYIQMEDELASMAAIIGASLSGLRSFTATSGPGFSLMQENLGMAVMAEVPCVVVNVQRSGPSTGLATKPAQADVMQSRWGTHGDHAIIALSPASVQECFTLAAEAFPLAEEYRTPVILLADEIVGHMRERVHLPQSVDVPPRPEPPAQGEYRPYQVTDGQLAPLARFGGPHVFHVTSSMHGEWGLPDNTPENARAKISRLSDKIEGRADDLTRARFFRGDESVDIRGGTDLEEFLASRPPADRDPGRVLLISFGASARTCLDLVWDPPPGLAADFLQLQTLWPFPDRLLKGLAAGYKQVSVVEMNLGQVSREAARVLGSDFPLVPVLKSNGEDIAPQEVYQAVRGVTM